MNILKFSFGHINVELSSQAVSNYEWLNKLFGNGEIGEPKDELDFNLNIYLKTVSRHKLRELTKRMIKLQFFYNDHNYEEFTNDEYTILLEKFLNEGPCFDEFEFLEKDYYICKKCGIKSINKIKFNYNKILPHELVQVTSTIKFCRYCNQKFHYTTDDVPHVICMRNGCIHDWI